MQKCPPRPRPPPTGRRRRTAPRRASRTRRACALCVSQQQQPGCGSDRDTLASRHTTECYIFSSGAVRHLARLEAAAWQRRYSGGAAAAGVACWGARGSVVPSIQQCGGSSMTAAVSHHQRAARPPAERVRRRLGYRPPNARRLRSLRTMVCATTASRLRNDRYAPRCTRWILHTTVLQ